MIINADHKGQTAAGRYAYRPLVTMTESDYPPDSLYWRKRYETAAKQYVDLVGQAAYCSWIDAIQTEPENWKMFYGLVRMAIVWKQFSNLVIAVAEARAKEVAAMPCICGDPYVCACRPPEDLEHGANLARKGQIELIEAM